ncbi:MAG: zf-HC2 domain-containing protein [Planctomycetaceae bacterium]|nr:zf-HC2 domain-containing protein [Planctomycetaceae bacterium]
MSDHAPQVDPSSDGEKSPEEWSPCPKGTLVQFSCRQCRKRLLKKIERGLEVTIVLIVAVTAGWFVTQRMSVEVPKHDYAGINCQEVIDVLPTYIDGSADPQLVRQIDAHLAACPRCLEFVEKKREEFQSRQVSEETAAAEREEGVVSPIVAMSSGFFRNP